MAWNERSVSGLLKSLILAAGSRFIQQGGTDNAHKHD